MQPSTMTKERTWALLSPESASEHQDSDNSMAATESWCCNNCGHQVLLGNRQAHAIHCTHTRNSPSFHQHGPSQMRRFSAPGRSNTPPSPATNSSFVPPPPSETDCSNAWLTDFIAWAEWQQSITEGAYGELGPRRDRARTHVSRAGQDPESLRRAVADRERQERERRLRRLHHAARYPDATPGILDVLERLSLDNDGSTGRSGPACGTAMTALADEVLTPTTAAHLREDKATCCICLTEFDEGASITRLPCLHVYHSSCVRGWLQRSGTCPVCKQRFG